MSAVRFAGAALLASRAAQQWTYQGCFVDSVSNRTLTHYANVDNSAQTVESCTSYCGSNGYSWAGLEYGSECYCDYHLTGATQEDDSECSMTCAGNSTETCGNSNRLSVYSNGNAGPSTNQGIDGWDYLACYTDSGNSRTLRNSQSIAGSSGMTVAACTAACQSSGYDLAGVEYANECWCDNAIQNAASTANSGCDMPCQGNSSEYCGGSDRLNVYQTSVGNNSDTAPTGWSTLGCFTDDVSNRTLVSSQGVPGGASNMTTEGCLGVCSSLGYSYAGLEYAQECFCGNAIQGSGGCASDQTTCYMPCKGNTKEICGGPSRLNVYYSGSDESIVACSASATKTSTVISSTFTVSSSATLSSSPATSISVSSSTIPTSTISALSSTTSSSVLSSSSVISSTSSSSSVASPSPSSSSLITSSSSSTLVATTMSSTPTSTSPLSTICPTFWSAISQDLGASMRDGNGQCNNFARAAIRYAFHDAAGYSSKTTTYTPASGGADGSLLLSATEINRTDNDGLHDYHAQIGQKLQTYRSSGYTLSAADLIQVAGALGVLACPGGRIGRVYVGRTDTTTPCPDGLLPQAFGPGSDHNTIYQLFVDKGFAARDLAALIGAHSSSIANFQTANGIPAGTPQDDTPGLWDMDYYNQTYYPVEGMARFESDINLSNTGTTVGKQFSSFVGNQGAWGASFASAFQTLSLLGIPFSTRRNFQDCTTVVAGVFPA